MPSQLLPSDSSTSSSSEEPLVVRVDYRNVFGRPIPRIFTPPLVPPGPSECPCGVCGLDRTNSDGFDFIDFNRDILASPLDEWQKFVSIHGLELLPDGRPRFRHVLVMVGRQNGKTEIPVRLALFWQFVDEIPMVLGTSTKLDYAKESWFKSIALAEKAPGIPIKRSDRRKWTRQANGEQESWNTTADGQDCRYKIAPANEEGGRSLTVHRLILDELRQHKSYAAWGASVPAVNAVPDGQVWALSNQGDVSSVVLNDKMAAAHAFIENLARGVDPMDAGDYRLGLFEYSSPPGSKPTDLDALAYSNPTLGHRIDPEILLGDARTAEEAGGEALTTFQIEVMCIQVSRVESAIDATAWAALELPGTLADCRSRVACCLDLSPDGMHATLVAAARIDPERVRLEVVKAWSGVEAADQLRRELPALLTQVRPRVLGWLPGGPAAALAADMRRKQRGWLPAFVKVSEITTETTAICMGMAEQVVASRVVYAPDALLTAHVTQAEKKWTVDTWRFARSGGGHVDAAYAAAGALHLARTLPYSAGPPRIIVATR